MARKPNYRFDRMEKDRAKAAKKAERLKAKQEKQAATKRGAAGETPEDALATPAADATPPEPSTPELSPPEPNER